MSTNLPSCILHRTNIPESITSPNDITNYVIDQQKISNSAIELFEFNGLINDHNYIIPLVDIWMGLRTDQNPNITGGTININGVIYMLSVVTETLDNNFSYWRASVEPGQFNIYNILSVELDLTFSSESDGKIYSTYGIVTKGKTIDLPVNNTYKYAFDTLNLDTGDYLGISHSLYGVNSILYENGKLGYDPRNFNTCTPMTYGIYVPKYYVYAYNYVDFIYNNSTRIPTFLGGNKDDIKSQGKILEIFTYVMPESILGNKYIYNDQLYADLIIKNYKGILLGVPVGQNTGIINVQFSIDGNTYFDCKKVTETYIDTYNNSFTETFWRLTKEPIILDLIPNTIIYYKIIYNSLDYLKSNIYYNMGFPKQLRYNWDPNTNKIYLNSNNNLLDVYYLNNNLHINSIIYPDKTFMRLSDIEPYYVYAQNVLEYINQTRTIV
jgi:hypothetical protein